MITDRNLRPGDQLAATYKGQQHRAVVTIGKGDRTTITLLTSESAGVECASVSQAAGLITDSSVNGWRFWTVVQAEAEAFEWRDDQPPIDLEATEVVATASIDPATIPPEGMTLTVPIPAPTRRRRRAQDRELDRPIGVAPTGNGHHHGDELIGQGFARAGVCAECRGPLEALGDHHYHERMARTYVGAEPVCCACRGHVAGEA